MYATNLIIKMHIEKEKKNDTLRVCNLKMNISMDNRDEKKSKDEMLKNYRHCDI